MNEVLFHFAPTQNIKSNWFSCKLSLNLNGNLKRGLVRLVYEKLI